MATLFRIGGTAAIAALICGCAMSWVRPGSSPEQARDDNAACQISAAGHYPPNIIRAHSLSSGEPKLDQDVNALLRDEDAKFCMRQKGYTFEHVG
jgi:hypothetical protein